MVAFTTIDVQHHRPGGCIYISRLEVAARSPECAGRSGTRLAILSRHAHRGVSGSTCLMCSNEQASTVQRLALAAKPRRFDAHLSSDLKWTCRTLRHVGF